MSGLFSSRMRMFSYGPLLYVVRMKTCLMNLKTAEANQTTSTKKLHKPNGRNQSLRKLNILCQTLFLETKQKRFSEPVYSLFKPLKDSCVGNHNYKPL